MCISEDLGLTETDGPALFLNVDFAACMAEKEDLVSSIAWEKDGQVTLFNIHAKTFGIWDTASYK